MVKYALIKDIWPFKNFADVSRSPFSKLRHSRCELDVVAMPQKFAKVSAAGT